MRLCRHRLDRAHYIFGYGVIIEDFGNKCRVRWINPSTKWTEHVMHKKGLLLLDKQGNLIEPEIIWKN